VSPAERALSLAHEVGFDHAALAPCAPPPDLPRFDAWLAAGRHADMDWLARERERIAEPRRLLPTGKTLLVVGLAHPRPAVRLGDGARVARYAAGRDYHNLVTKRLRRLARRLVAEGLASDWRAVVDAGPVLERSHAVRAGLGFESKAANVLTPEHGPWVFLGELLLDAELDADPTPLPAGSCGTCTACLDACPTEAIVEPGIVDARLCISYQTIENRGSIPRALREALGEWVFGCDVCSEVCPWGRAAGDRSDVFGTHPAVERGSLVDWLGRSESTSAEALRGSPLQRTQPVGLARNAALALGNRPSYEGLRALRVTLETHASPVVRESAGWALLRGHGADAGVRAAVERAAQSEPDPAARAELRSDLDESR
jgi:epoxyqueuosine reductase